MCAPPPPPPHAPRHPVPTHVQEKSLRVYSRNSSPAYVRAVHEAFDSWVRARFGGTVRLGERAGVQQWSVPRRASPTPPRPLTPRAPPPPGGLRRSAPAHPAKSRPGRRSHSSTAAASAPAPCSRGGQQRRRGPRRARHRPATCCAPSRRGGRPDGHLQRCCIITQLGREMGGWRRQDGTPPPPRSARASLASPCIPAAREPTLSIASPQPLHQRAEGT